MKLGPTGDYPHGKLNPEDEGGLQMAITHDSKGNVRIDFGVPVAWLAFPSDMAITFANLVLYHAGARDKP